jgi:activator of HSP90 ATPase
MHFRPLPYKEFYSRKVRLHRYYGEKDDCDVDDMPYPIRPVGDGGEILSRSAAFQYPFTLGRTLASDDQLGVDVYDEEEAERNIVFNDTEDFQMFLERTDFDHNIAQKLWKTESLPRVFRQYVNNLVVSVDKDDDEMPVGSDLRVETAAVANKNTKHLAKSSSTNRIPNTGFAATKKPATTASASSKQLQKVAREIKRPKASSQLERKQSIKRKLIPLRQLVAEKVKQASNVTIVQEHQQQIQPIQQQLSPPMQLTAQQMQQQIDFFNLARFHQERQEEFQLRQTEERRQQQQQQDELLQNQRALLMISTPVNTQQQKLKMLERVRRSRWRLERKRLNKLKKSDMDNKIANPAKLSFLERKLESETNRRKGPEATSPSTAQSSSSVVSILSDTATSQNIKNESTFMQYVHQLQRFKLEHGHWCVLAIILCR